jgi:hypothetical protein
MISSSVEIMTTGNETGGDNVNYPIPTGYTHHPNWKGRIGVAQAVHSTEPRSVTLAELPAHLWAKPALWARTLPYLSLNLSYLASRGDARACTLVQGEVTSLTLQSLLQRAATTS